MAAASEATLVFTDIVGSTRLVEQLGDAAAAQLWARHDRRVRDLLRRHNGREVDRTDGFFAIFDRAPDAAAFAAACHEVAAELALRARVALHTGTVMLRENDPTDIARGAKPMEVEGLAKPFAARLNALAAPGQTLASAAACAALGASTGALRSHGHYRLKGVAEPTEVFELGHGAAPAFAPPDDTDKAYRVMRTADDLDGAWRPVRKVHHNLPAERDAFVGRAAELHALASRLDSGERLVTVLGPGGIGKTRFVRRYARVWLGDWPGGVHFCDLSDARSADGVLSAVAVGLGIPLGRGDVVAQLGHAIAGRGPCLVILDNVEQVLDAVATPLSRWLDRAADARFVVTSRERLRLDGEGVLPLETLPLDGDTGGAVALFMVRARAQLPHFATDAAQRAEVARIVRLLDGMPLAIELAAARVRLLSPAQIVERLRDRFVLLAGGRGAAARQATLRGTIDWSWELLSPIEQSAFAQCAVFEGGFTLAAAEAVLDLARWGAATATIDIVQALLDKSLLRAWRPRGNANEGEPRFGMYASLHEYARERLDASGKTAANPFAAGMATPDEAVTCARRHAEWFHRLLARAASDIEGGDAAALDAIAAELENCRLAWRWAIAADATAALAGSAPALMRYFEARGRAEEGAALLAEALPRVATMPATHAADVLSALAHLQYRVYRLDDAAASARRALRLARTTASAETRLRCLNVIGLCHWQWGRLTEARRLLGQSLRLARATEQPRAIAIALGNLATVDKDLGHYERARVEMLEVLERQRALGDWLGVAIRLNNLASLHQARQEWNEARAFLDEALAVAARHGIAFVRPHALVNLALVDFFTGDLEAAARHGREALAEARTVANRNVEATALLHLVRVAVRQSALDEARSGVREALACALAMGSMSLQLDAVFCHAEIAAATGERATAAHLLRWYLARPEVAPGDRAVAQASLDALPGTEAKADPDLPPDLPLEDLLQRLAQPSPAARAAD